MPVATHGSRELRERIVQHSSFSENDFAEIHRCRRDHNQLGFAYQLAFVRLLNRFPTQLPFELLDDVLTFVSAQTEIATDKISDYAQRQPTISSHQSQIRTYLELRLFEDAQEKVEQFLFEECCRLEQTSVLRQQALEFLREHSILQPGSSVLDRVIGEQRRQARARIFSKIAKQLSDEIKSRLDELLVVGDGPVSGLQRLRDPPGVPSAGAMLRLTTNIEAIRDTGVLTVDLSWLNNNYRRTLARFAKKCTATRLRRLKDNHRFATLTCFLKETYQDGIDQLVDMQDKLLARLQSQAKREVDEALTNKRKSVQRSVRMLEKVGAVVLDEAVPDEQLRQSIFSEVSREELASQIEDLQELTNGKSSHEFHGLVRRFSYLRRFTPAMLEHLSFDSQNGHRPAILDALETLASMNADGKRTLPEDVPMDFIPAKLKPFVENGEGINRQAWECALLLSMREEIRSGNITVDDSKRFGDFNDFFIDETDWHQIRPDFFKRSGLPQSPDAAFAYLTERLNSAYDKFNESLPDNAYATVDESGWNLSTDNAEKLSSEEAAKLETLKTWLTKHMRQIRLPDLLIEVDNDLGFTKRFSNASKEAERNVEDVCATLVTLMAHGCNIGTYTMSRLTEGVSYSQIKRISDWQLTTENQRAALADVVGGISSLGTSLTWGEGRTSASDGQRFLFPRKVLQRTFSHRMSDFALEFYSFIADNYAPYYSGPIECTDRDAGHVLDGLLYNESDLPLEEHYTDTHGYTEINFAAFAMLRKRFCPRIRGLQGQRIYRIDTERDYGPIAPLLEAKDRKINLQSICHQWDRMGQFYASLESGHTTASVALKRLAGYSKKNHFYKANRELGRIFKTEFVLEYMSQPLLRRRVRRGLLKTEQLHSMARDVCYGKRGRITVRDLQEQMTTCSCLTLILACIIYWQIKEIERVVCECEPEKDGVDVALIEHISPIEWDNVLLYGEYVINRRLIQAA